MIVSWDDVDYEDEMAACLSTLHQEIARRENARLGHWRP